jgi:hypothetical protein
MLSKIKHSTFWMPFSLVLGTTPRIALDADRMGIGIMLVCVCRPIRELARSTTTTAFVGTNSTVYLRRLVRRDISHSGHSEDSLEIGENWGW